MVEGEGASIFKGRAPIYLLHRGQKTSSFASEKNNMFFNCSRKIIIIN